MEENSGETPLILRSTSGPETELQTSQACVIVPTTDNLKYTLWEVWIFTLLFLSAYFIPFDVVIFAHSEPYPASALIFNDILNVTFTVDMVLNFFVAYENNAGVQFGKNTKWEMSPRKIMCRYLAWPLSGGGGAGWFWLDLLATGPAWLDFAFSAGRTSERDHAASNQFKVLMLLRLLRIIRMLRLGRTYRNFVLKYVRLGFSLNLVEVVKFLVITTLSCHILALAWVSIESQVWKGVAYELLDLHSGTESSWLSVMIEDKTDPCSPSAKENGICVYTLALYWAIMTITSVGYGDISPQSVPEYVLCNASILILGFTWAYVVGSIVSLISNFDPYGSMFNQQMDDLNEMCDSRNVPTPLRRKLRDYMTMSSHIPKLRGHRRMLETRLSKRLKDTILHLNSGELLSSVFWADNLQDSAKLEIVGRMNPHFFGPEEEVVLRSTMIMIRQGRAVMNFKILSRGSVAGEVSILLETESLISETLKTLTYVDALTLEKRDLREVCAMYPSADSRLRRAQVRCAAWRAFCRAARVHAGFNVASVETMLNKTGGSFAKCVPLDQNGRMMHEVQDSMKVVHETLRALREAQQHNQEQLTLLQDELGSILSMAPQSSQPGEGNTRSKWL